MKSEMGPEMPDWPTQAAMVADEAGALKGPVKRVGAPQIPAPVASTHEKIISPARKMWSWRFGR